MEAGKQWVVFFQDTNGLAFATLAAALGVSKNLDLEVPHTSQHPYISISCTHRTPAGR
jgi:hypothetical protein